MACQNPHPDDPTLLCDSPAGNHRLCTGYDAGKDDFVDWRNPDYVEPKAQSSRKDAQERLQTAAARVAPAIRVAPASASASSKVAPPTGIVKGFAESERAARRWTDAEKAQVMAAIVAVAERNDEFTSDVIWAELAGAVPVTKGLTSLLRVAVRNGILDSTGKTEISSRGGDHDHGQRLTVWYSLIQKKR